VGVWMQEPTTLYHQHNELRNNRLPSSSES
jgi:hypothetical protein